MNAGGIWSNNNGVTHAAFPGPCDTTFLVCQALPNFSDTLALGSTFASNFGNNSGGTAGGQFGYNWQFSPNGVAGFEADINWTGQRNNNVIFNSVTVTTFPPDAQAYQAVISRQLNYIGTVRGRLGFLATPTFLLYGTAGLAYGGTRSSTAESVSLLFDPNIAVGVGGGSFSQTRAGWTAGAGGEWMFAPNWSAKVEGLYYDLGSVNYATALQQFCTTPGCAVQGGLIASTSGITSLRFNGAIARVGVNYHFGGPTLGY